VVGFNKRVVITNNVGVGEGCKCSGLSERREAVVILIGAVETLPRCRTFGDLLHGISHTSNPMADEIYCGTSCDPATIVFMSAFMENTETFKVLLVARRPQGHSIMGIIN